MKSTLIICLLLAGMGAQAQTTDSSFMLYSLKMSFAIMSTPYIAFESDLNGHGNATWLIDSGKILIYGDTLKAIRELAKLYNNAQNKIDSIKLLADRVITSAPLSPWDSLALVCHKRELRRYCLYAYHDPKAIITTNHWSTPDFCNNCPVKKRKLKHP
jgi:hypothetical protein